MKMNATINVEATLLWMVLGIVIVLLALAGIGFYIPEWAPWAAGLGLPLASMLLAGLAVWILLAWELSRAAP